MFTEINFVDESLRHCGNFTYGSTVQVGGVKYPLTHREPQKIKYVRDKLNWDGVTVFTDLCLDKAKKITSKYKVAWLIEPRHYLEKIYKTIEKYIDYYDLVLTYDPILLKKYAKCKFIPADTVVIENEAIRIHNKKKLVSFSLSEKNFLEGHKFRMHAMNQLKKNTKIDFYGSGPKNFVSLRSDTIKEYMFSIAIENGVLDNYFTDRILDLFATGTIPIYRGAPNISDFFDVNGILSFRTYEELVKIIENLDENLYLSKIHSMKKNFDLCKKYLYLDDEVLNIINLHLQK
jgi:hypothetical protein